MSIPRIAPRTFYSRAFALLLAAFTVVLTYLVIEPVWRAIAWALVLAVVLHPWQQWLVGRLRRSWLAAGALTIAAFFLVVVPVSALVGAFGAELTELATIAKAGGGSRPASSLTDLRDVPVAGPRLDEWRQTLGISPTSVRDLMQRGLTAMLEALGPLSGRLVVGAVGGLTTFAMMLVVLFFFLRDAASLRLRIDTLIPWPRAVRQQLTDHLAGVIRAIVSGTLVTAVLQGVLVGLAFVVLGLPGPVVFGAAASVLATIPIGGTALVWGPASLYLAIDDRWWAAGALLAWGLLLVGTIDNLLKPILVSGRAHVGTLTVFLGVIGGLAAFGVLGLVLGPLILSLAIALLELVRQRTTVG